MKHILASVSLAAAVIAGPMVVAATGTAKAASLIANGSFETNTNFVDNSGVGGDAMNLAAPGVTTISGWTTMGGGTVLWAGPSSSAYMGGLVASDGGYFLDLTGLTNQCAPLCAGVSQTFNTASGQGYKLSFDFGGRNDSIPVEILAMAGASFQTFTTSAVTSTPTSWASASLSFTGTGSPIVISLLGIDAANSGLDLSLDNVSVTTTPLPSTWLMLLGSLLALGYFLHRGTSTRSPGFATP